MEWLAALGVFAVGIGFVPLVVSRKSSRGGGIGAFASDLVKALDPDAALVALENEKRLQMEGEEDNGDPPLES